MLRKIKKSLSVILAFLFIFNLIPSKTPVAYAANLPKVTIRNVYEEFNRTQKILTITDEVMALWTNESKSVSLNTNLGFQKVPNLQTFGSSSVQANLDINLNITSILLEGIRKEDDIGSEKTYTGINEGIVGIHQLENPIITVGKPIIAVGSEELSTLVGDEEYSIRVGNVEATAKLGSSNSRIEITPKRNNEQFTPGIQDITITREVTQGGYTLENVFVYRKAVTIIGTFNLDGISMFPTAGEPGSTIAFTRSSYPFSSFDIYLIEDLNNPSLFKEANRLRNFQYAATTEGDQVITAQVPTIPIGSYHVVFTNASSQQQGIQRQYVLSQKFTVIAVSARPSIEGIQPDRAPALTPTPVTITGNLFTTPNIQGLTISKTPAVEDVTYTGGKAILNYGSGRLQLPEGGEADVEVTREFEVEIGQPLEIETGGFIFKPEDSADPNTIEVTTKVIEVQNERKVDVVVRVTTRITIPDEDNRELVIVQRTVHPEGFTYFPSTEVPNVIEVVPSIIPIESEGNNHYIASSIGELLISIRGSNFLVTKTMDGTQEVTRYPRVRIGGVDIDPNLPGAAGMKGNNTYKPLSFEVMRGNVLVDGAIGNEIGDRILIRLKAGRESEAFRIINKDSRSVAINNPIRESMGFSATFRTFPEMVRFVAIDENEFPVIDSVQPSLVAMEGGQQIIVTGSNLRTGARVFIDNKLVPNVQIAGDNKRITFNAPAGSRPGMTQLQIINPDGGGIATHPFTYTTTYTQPRLNLINPKQGTNDTLVNMKGANFLNADPTVTVNDLNNINEFLMYRLIGSRVLMDGHDINRYNRGANNQIRLLPFMQGVENRVIKDSVFIYANNQVQLGDSFDSVILFGGGADEPSRFYTITRNIQNQYAIEDGLGGRYVIRYQNGQFQAVRGSSVYTLELNNTKGKVIMKQGAAVYRELESYTPYHIEEKTERVEGETITYHQITGKRVEFVDSNTLLFRVPVLRNSPWSGPGDYDVTIVNPDTKSVTLPRAFRYYSEPQVTPVVEDVLPEEGPEAGGNRIRLITPDDGNPNTGFIDTGTTKTQVFIGSQQVPANQVTVSPDGREISLIVPSYYESIKEKGTDRITVPIVLINPDGGTFYISYSQPISVSRTEADGSVVEKLLRGYTYVVPGSNPRINEIIPKEGPADGGYIVEIFGFDFRDYKNIFDAEGNIIQTLKADTDKKSSRYNPQYQVMTSDLYPQVYFGNREAEIVQFAYNYMQVVAPPGDGSVDVYIINNDSGISNKVRFTYRKSQPVITSVTPRQGDRRGGSTIEILGRDFLESTITLLDKPYDNEGESTRKTLKMATVKVGDRNNFNVPRDNPTAGGLIRSSRATVNLSGGLRAHYNADGTAETSNQPTLEVSIEDRGKVYGHQYVGGIEIEKPLYINTKDLKTSQGEAYPYEELIRLEVKDNRLLVEAGYAPNVVYRSNQHLEVTMPAYFTIGTIPLEVVNPDGGRGRSSFEYKNPDSNPFITNITKEGGREPVTEIREGYGEIKVLQVNDRGGNIVSVWGNDFRENATIQISNLLTISPQNIDYSLPTKLTFTMPAVPEAQVGRLHRVVVNNNDGASATSDKAQPPIYLEFIKGESDPRLQTITPDRGLTTGGTRVKITGNDFRKTMEGFEGEVFKVFFGEAAVFYEEDNDHLDIQDYKTLYVNVPASNKPGNVVVRVENPDGSLATPPLQFTYISKPVVDSINPTMILTNDTESEITITGEMFMPGAKVILGGTIIGENEVKPQDQVLATGITEVRDGKNIESAVVGGVEAASVTVVDDNTMMVKFNETLNLPNNDIIIVNPDGGISEPYKGFDYKIPIPTKPLVVEAIPGYESTVQLLWSDSAPEVLNAADKYEVYGKRSSDRNYSFIGDTKGAEFLVRGLEPNTRYDFMVRALNRYGSALEFAEVSARTLNLREDDKLKDKQEELDKADEKLRREGKEEVVGGALIKTIGTEQIPTGSTSYTVDFSLSQYNSHNKFIVAIPVSLLSTLDRRMVITDGRASFSFTPSGLYTREVIQGASGNVEDAHVQITFERVSGQEAEGLYSAVSRTQRRASNIYSIDFNLQAGKNTTAIRRMLQTGNLTVNFDARSYPNVDSSKLFIGQYDASRHEFTRQRSGSVGTVQEPARFMLIADR